MFVWQVYKPKRPHAANDPLRAPADITGSLDFEERLSEKVTLYRFLVIKGANNVTTDDETNQ